MNALYVFFRRLLHGLNSKLGLKEVQSERIHDDQCLVQEVFGATRFVECGPGKVLSGLTRRIDENAATFALNDRAAIDDALAALRAA